MKFSLLLKIPWVFENISDPTPIRGQLMRRTILSVLLVFALQPYNAATADDLKPTIYADGRSCPNNCDAHVVFNIKHNGTGQASDPSSSRQKPKLCANGKPCRICFSKSDNSCLVATYRGGGPAPGRFDFTPAFFEEVCPKPALPQALANLCHSFNRTLEKLMKGKIYCVANPEESKCKSIIAAAEKIRIDDQILYDECNKLGENKFNIKYRSKPKKQRDNACSYERYGTGGPNSHGQSWRRLLPAACWPGTYVGRDGTDCCDRNMMAVGGLGTECKPFLVAK